MQKLRRTLVRLKLRLFGVWWRIKYALFRERMPRNKDGKVYLNLGCGDYTSDEFINMDAVPFRKTHLVADIQRLYMFPSGSVDLIYASHVLEHIPRRNLERTLREWYRVLKPGGILRCGVPDFDGLVEIYHRSGSEVESSPWIEWSALLLVVCDRARRARAGVHEALWVVVAAGFIVRWKLLAGTLGLSLGGGDATVYQNLAMQFTWAHPYDTYFREPAFIWMQHSAAALFGPNELSFRLSSMTASLMSVVLIYFLACALSDRVTAIFAAGLMALGDFVVTLSVRGDRNDTYTFFMLLFCLCLITFKNRHWRSEALLGLIGAVLSLVWLVGLPAVGFLYLCRWFRNKISAAHAVYFFIVLGAFLIPHFVYQYRHFGDPFFALNHPANALEGIAKTGVPSDWSGGSTWAHVIGSGMGIIGFVRRFFMGYVDLFLNPTNLYNKSFLGFHYSLAYSYLLYPFLIVGYVVEIRRRNFLPFLLLFGFLNVMVIFLQEAIIPRWFLHAAPFVAYFWAAGAAAVFRAIKVKSSLDGKP
jgi:SAM-dependent methyltransferase